MLSYCLKCRKNTERKKPKVIKTETWTNTKNIYWVIK